MAWENTELDPNIDVPYIEESYLPGPSARFTFGGPASLAELNPTYVVTVHVPENVGIGAANGYADATTSGPSGANYSSRSQGGPP